MWSVYVKIHTGIEISCHALNSLCLVTLNVTDWRTCKDASNAQYDEMHCVVNFTVILCVTEVVSIVSFVYRHLVLQIWLLSDQYLTSKRVFHDRSRGPPTVASWSRSMLGESTSKLLRRKQGLFSLLWNMKLCKLIKNFG